VKPESETKPIFESLIGYRRLHIMSVACELNIFTLLKENPQSCDSLVEKTGARPMPMKALLDACVGLELLRPDSGGYRNTPAADHFLTDDSPYYIGHLLHVFVTEVPQWFGLFDRITRDRIPNQPGRTTVAPRRFTLAMHSLGMMDEASSLAESLPVPLSGRMIDVGCGSGVYSIFLCKKFPSLRATMIDTEEVLKTTREIVEKSGITGRLTLRARDILRDEYGKNRDVILLSDVLYGPDENCLDIIKSAHRSLKKDGLLIIRGYYSKTETCQPPFAAVVNLTRLLWHPRNRPITVEQLKQCLSHAGFSRIKTFPVTTRSIGMVAFKT
jgi:hypothetical protein